HHRGRRARRRGFHRPDGRPGGTPPRVHREKREVREFGRVKAKKLEIKECPCASVHSKIGIEDGFPGGFCWKSLPCKGRCPRSGRRGALPLCRIFTLNLWRFVKKSFTR